MREIRVEYRRGGRLESVHHVSVAVVEGGRAIFERGEVSRPIYLRSCAKPFQSTTVVETGAADAFGLAPEEIAVMSGSHGGEPEQVRAVESILRKAKLTPQALRCGTHPPSSPKGLAALLGAHRTPTVLHNNCSGKHSGMVAAAKHLKWDLKTYLDPSHPLQKRNLATISRFSEVPARKIGVGRDGCSAPTFAIPLARMARAAAQFAQENGSAKRVRESMMAHPAMVGRPCVSVMSLAPGRIVAKGGAEGAYLLGLAGRGVGLAAKVEDGSLRAIVHVLRAVLGKLKLLSNADLSAMGKIASPVLRNHANLEVGEILVLL